MAVKLLPIWTTPKVSFAGASKGFEGSASIEMELRDQTLDKRLHSKPLVAT